MNLESVCGMWPHERLMPAAAGIERQDTKPVIGDP
jgi:hypothetical protein